MRAAIAIDCGYKKQKENDMIVGLQVKKKSVERTHSSFIWTFGFRMESET